MSSIDKLIRELRMAVARARRNPVRDKRGNNATTVTITMPAHIGSMVANRLEMTQDRLVANAKFKCDMQNLVDVSEDALADNNLRFHYAMTDLELLLERYMGRQPMTLQEVREQRQITEARPSPGPQPFIRKKPGIQVSNELKNSIRERRIGNPREPGEEG